MIISSISSTMMRSTSRNTEQTGTTIAAPDTSDSGIWSEDTWRSIAEKGDAEVRAAQKIADAKKELESLKRAGFPPEVLAKLAAELLNRVQSAAGEFAQAMGAASGAGGVGASSSVAVGAAYAAAATPAELSVADVSSTTLNGSDETSDASVAADDGHGSVEEKTARSAYQTVMDDASSITDKEQSKLEDQFKALIAQLKRLIDRASHGEPA